ncbi:filamentous hemagglutinin N-terminal domain-containing protein [Nodosilinea sp. P-1105]|uniref:filamentous hemagglutinin N-terminal domain-containing protein n=1 Tax=Nodosilinea sp. P-1105 TaxID=2546229 RepID=UPI00146A8D84|nr:filamentous hemagglutinin N-terminal domain-containing protein [Nodosilinea sp. P-1105]NMF83372.1 filamentous hemagglutinin N-terminal domain-containing protein [Nodosilinea sp. P-1105]
MGLGLVGGVSRGRLGLVLSLGAALAIPSVAQAQIIPDSTLDAEASRVLPQAVVDGLETTIIEGGAARGQNLFHSFADFNIDAGQRVYFANPAGIEAILSRVTGGNPSNIFGTLGVDGPASLFLINPNGIVFGENASLDIQGSFYASTAEAIALGDGVYSATEPEQSSLLTVNPSALFSTYLSDASGDIQNRGQLTAQGNLTLAANNLDLQGQVAAGGNLMLLGLDTVQIRDTADTPFVGFAGGDLLVQGNERVDIVALGHRDSGLYSYGDMVLRSGNPVAGDAHYWSGGSFRVETLNEALGQLFSPIDPIIRALGDVNIEGYRGSSLHVLAGGSVTIGTAYIYYLADSGVPGIDFLQETLVLTDGTVISIDGGAQPTLDIRAGISPNIISIPVENITGLDLDFDRFLDQSLQLTQPSFFDLPSTADISIGDAWIDAPNGLVLLSNQYEPNVELSRGDILVTGEGFWGDGIYVSRFGEQSGAVFIDSRGDMGCDLSRETL